MVISISLIIAVALKSQFIALHFLRVCFRQETNKFVVFAGNKQKTSGV